MNQAFKYLRPKLPRLTDIKIKHVFIDLEIRNLFREHCIDRLPQGGKKAAWESFKSISTFWGNKELESELLSSCDKLGCNMSLKITVLHAHLDISPQSVKQEVMNTTIYSIKAIEKRCDRKWTHAVLADYCRTITTIVTLYRSRQRVISATNGAYFCAPYHYFKKTWLGCSEKRLCY